MVAVLLSLATTALSGCGLGPEAHPVVVGADPGGGGFPSSRPDLRVVTVDVFLLRGDRLVRATRPVQSAVGLQAALVALSQSLSSAEADAGLRTALPSAATRPTGTVDGSVARISMPRGFDRLPLHEQVGAMSQLVWTVTAHTGAASVRLVVDDLDIPVPDGRGQLLDRPVGRTDYVDWAPVGVPLVEG